jgi:hypothetical protein
MEDANDQAITSEEGVDTSAQGQTNQPKEDKGQSSTEEAKTSQDDTVEVNGEKLTKDQLAELVSKGKDYTQKTQTLADKEREIAKKEEELKQANLTQEERTKIESEKAYLEKLGYKPADVMRKEWEAEQRQQKASEALNAQLTTLSEKYDGSDGRPKFDSKQAIIEGRQQGIYDPEAWYFKKHYNELIDWGIKQARKGPKGTFTERGMSRGSKPTPEKPASTFEEAEERMMSDTSSRQEE